VTEEESGVAGRVKLRDLNSIDLPVLYAFQADPASSRMAAVPSRGREAFDEHWARILADDSIVKRTIEFGGRVAGSVVCFERHGLREVGYWIDRKLWGRGIASQALMAFLEQVAERPLHARVAKHNVASLRVLRKNGFVIIGEDRIPTVEGGPEVDEFLLRLDAGGSAVPR
jgi:RimJ/RimL family protein N-acetyltransferase